jgi:hypothetical protein
VIPKVRSGANKNDVIEMIVTDCRELNNGEFTENADIIIRKLLRDGYIEERGLYYWITLDGKLFSTQGGYKGEMELRLINQEYQKHQSQVLKTYQRHNISYTNCSCSLYSCIKSLFSHSQNQHTINI